MPSPQSVSTTLEAKIDNLAHQLELLLGTGPGGCPVCRTCGMHSHQHEATQRQLAAQSRLLEKLERKIEEMQKTLGTVKGWCQVFRTGSSLEGWHFKYKLDIPLLDGMAYLYSTLLYLL